MNFHFQLVMLLLAAAVLGGCESKVEGAAQGGQTHADWSSEMVKKTSACDIEVRRLGTEIAKTRDGKSLKQTNALILAAKVAEQCRATEIFFRDKTFPSDWSGKDGNHVREILDVCADAYLRKVRIGNAIADQASDEIALGSLVRQLEFDIKVLEKCRSGIARF